MEQEGLMFYLVFKDTSPYNIINYDAEEMSRYYTLLTYD